MPIPGASRRGLDPRWLAPSMVLLVAGCAPRSAGPPGYPPQAPSSGHPVEDDPDPEVNNAEWRTFGWLSVAIGANSAIAAAATSGLTLSYKSTRDADCNAMKLCSAAGLNANNQISSLAVWNAGAWILAGAGLAAGTTILLTHPIDKAGRASITLAPRGTTGGVGLEGSF